jgi:hypothetical protein
VTAEYSLCQYIGEKHRIFFKSKGLKTGKEKNKKRELRKENVSTGDRDQRRHGIKLHPKDKAHE